MNNDCKEDCKIGFSCRIVLLLIALMVIVLDQASKYWARSNLQLFMPKEVVKYWNWQLNYNQGAAFSFLANQASWSKIMFAVLAIVVAVGLIYYILSQRYSRLAGLAFSFILGGAIGNLIDRIIFGKVTDFIDWYYASYHWPTFNIADSFITIGVALLIIIQIFFSKTK